jgi:RNA polymerase sigma-70 factor (ECF subfamily)
MAISSAGSLQLKTEKGAMSFEEVFKTHFKSLHSYAFTMVKEEMTAEEMVQNVFCRLWEKKGELTIQSSATAYLYRSVYNECLNYIKHQKVKAAYEAFASKRTADELSPCAGTGNKSVKITQFV